VEVPAEDEALAAKVAPMENVAAKKAPMEKVVTIAPGAKAPMENMVTSAKGASVETVVIGCKVTCTML
jgi:hypothetical protein